MIDLDPNLHAQRLQVIASAIDAGQGAAALRLYTGPKPAPGGELTTQALIGQVQLSRPFAAAISGAQMTPAPIPPILVEITDRAEWGRIVSGSGAWVGDFKVRAPNDIDADQALIVITGGRDLVAGSQIIITVSPILDV